MRVLVIAQTIVLDLVDRQPRQTNRSFRESEQSS
jgi:hypothetical protein